MFVLLLDAATLGDPLFLPAFARDAQARRGGFVAVHGAGEEGERALEGAGAWPEAVGGVWRGPGGAALTAPQAAAVERAARELNRRVVHELNEAGVAAVRATGADRGLLRASTAGVEAGRVAWAETLVRQGGVLVVASLGAAGSDADPGAPLVEVDPAAAAAALGAALGVPVVVAASGRTPGLLGADGEPLAEAPLAALDDGRGVPDVAAVRRAVALGADVRVVRRAALREAGVPSGTRLGPA